MSFNRHMSLCRLRGLLGLLSSLAPGLLLALGQDLSAAPTSEQGDWFPVQPGSAIQGGSTLLPFPHGGILLPLQLQKLEKWQELVPEAMAAADACCWIHGSSLSSPAVCRDAAKPTRVLSVMQVVLFLSLEL